MCLKTKDCVMREQRRRLTSPNHFPLYSPEPLNYLRIHPHFSLKTPFHVRPLAQCQCIPFVAALVLIVVAISSSCVFFNFSLCFVRTRWHAVGRVQQHESSALSCSLFSHRFCSDWLILERLLNLLDYHSDPLSSPTNHVDFYMPDGGHIDD